MVTKLSTTNEGRKNKLVEIKTNILTSKSDQGRDEHGKGKLKNEKSFRKHGDNVQTTIGLKERILSGEISTLLDSEALQRR